MKVYDFAFSPNCRKVRAVAYELGLQLDYVPMNLLKGDTRAPSFLAINPNGRVPVLIDGDFELWESTAIIRYLSAKSGGELIPKTLQGQAECDRWLAWQLAHLGPAMSKVALERIVKKFTGAPPDEAAIAVGSADFTQLTAVLEKELAGREYVAQTLSVADFALASYYSLATMCGLDLAPFPRVSAWLSRMLARDSMRHTLADAQASLSPHAA
jgi:glutathione S-transferase